MCCRCLREEVLGDVMGAKDSVVDGGEEKRCRAACHDQVNTFQVSGMD